MNCPICQCELDSYPDPTHKEYQNSMCPIAQNDYHYNSHYYKYIASSLTHFDEIEEISLYPFRIKNIFQSYHEYTSLRKDGEEVERTPAHEVVSCFIYKYNHNKFKQFKISGGFDKILKLSEHIKADSEDKLRERIKLLLLLS